MAPESKKLLDHLNEVNDVPILSIEDGDFAPYGRILSGVDFSDAIQYMVQYTDVPKEGNIYVPSDERLEQQAVYRYLTDTVYGGMPIQMGYCNGRNSTYNGFEYHKGSEINVACCDFMLVLGHPWEIRDNTYDIRDAKVFFVPEGAAIEMYQTTLHLSPLKVSEDGFRDIVVLPRGTNTPLDESYAASCNCGDASKGAGDPERELLLQRNKWVIAHPEREPLIKQGAHAGVIGENKELYF